MRIVDLNKLSEEERKKVLEEQQTNLKQRQQESSELQRQANQKFNEIVSKKGEYTPSRTTTIGNLEKVYQNNNTVKESLNNYYNNNKTPLWDTIKGIADGIGKTTENGWLSFQNGLKSSGQTIGRAITNTQANRIDFWNQMDKESLEKRAKEHPEEAGKIKEIIENPLLSGEQIRKESEETTQKIQKEKEENNQKVQENADNINNPVGKYLAGNIAPAIGQMLPGIVGGGVGTTYFISSATGNYYDDAKQRGMTDDEATMYSGTMGIIEGSLESLGAKLTTNVGKQLLKKNIKGALVNYGLDVGENFLEESIVEPISELVAQTTAGKDKANWENIGQRFLQSGIDGAVTSMITGGVSGIIGGAGSKLRQNKYTDINTGKLLNKNSQNWLKEAENIINENNIANLQQNTTINQNNQSTQQTIQEINKMAQKGNMEQIEIDNEVTNMYSGQTNMTMSAKIGDKIVGTLDYSEYNGKPSISMIEVKPEYRRKGIATRLLQNLQSEYPNIEIEWGTMTTDGASLRDAITYNIENEDIKAIKNEIIDIDKKIEEYQTKFNNNILTEKEGDDWNRLEDRKYKLENEIYDKSEYTNLVNLANNQESLYNSSKERESDLNVINRGTQETDLGRDFSESRVLEERKQITEQNYREWEQSIKSKQDSELTYEEQQLKKEIKATQNKDIVFIKEDNGKGYYAGASLDNANTIYIKTEEAKKFGLNRTALHETMESNIRFSDASTQDIIMSTIDDMVNDYSFEKQKEEFWKDQDGDMPSDTAIAKDIICDRLAELNGETLDYENVLSDEIKNRIDMSIEYFKKELGNTSSFNLPTKADVKSKVNLPTKENINQPTQGEKIDWNTVERPEGKMRKHYRSIIESGNTTAEAKAIAKELMGTDTYVPDSNNKQLERANERIQNSTPESELNSLMSRATTGGKIDATDIAVGEKLIQYYSLIGDKAKLQESIQATAMAGTTAGRTVQAMSLLNHQTPEGQAIWIQRSVEKMNNDLKKAKGDKAQQFDFTAEMQEKIIKSKDKVELEKNLSEVYEELGQQVSKSLSQQIDSWRYFAMLGNFRTHIRNISGNFLMGTTQDIKSKVAGVIEGTVAKFNPDMERTHTIKRASKEVIAFAKDDIKNVADRLGLNDNKYNPKNRLENNMRTFKSDVMENTLGRMFKWNDNLLEAEDGLGLKAGYKKALAEYITANNIDINKITDKQLSKARNYAVQQAQERTFHQANTIASAINSFFGKNKATKAVGDAILPFVKTPANVAKTGIEYSPAGLAKSIVYDTVQLRKGNINVNQYIDNISKGLTGSAITVLGFALAQAGILKASGSDDDKKEKFDEQSGKQAYSIQIGDNTYTIDWLAPVGIPLMVGAEIYEGLSQKLNENKTKSSDDEDVAKQFWDKAEVLANSLSNTLDPMVEMSMISGLTSTVRSFAEGDTQALGNMLTNGAKSYINQFIPTLLGQIAKTTDTVERDTTSTKNGTLTKVVDSTVNQIKSKIPGLRQTLPTRKDIWGNDIKLADNWAQRFFEAGILPTNSKTINKDKVVTELNNLYDKIGESSILPTTIDKTFTVDGQKYRMTNKEYNKYKANYGKTSYKLIKDLVSSKEYNKMNNEQKQKAIENIYSYAKESNKLDYSKSNKLECEQSTLYTTMEDLKKNGGSQSEYLSYLSKITEVKKDKEKNQILADSSYTAKTKSIIYKNTTGKEDELYNNILLKDNININEYLNYKLQEFESDKKDDGTIQGKTVSGSKKKKVYEYVNNMNITPQQRMAILGTQYKLNREEQKVLYNYLNKIQTKTQKEKLDIFSKYSSNFTIYKDNALDFK